MVVAPKKRKKDCPLTLHSWLSQRIPVKSISQNRGKRQIESHNNGIHLQIGSRDCGGNLRWRFGRLGIHGQESPGTELCDGRPRGFRSESLHGGEFQPERTRRTLVLRVRRDSENPRLEEATDFFRRGENSVGIWNTHLQLLCSPKGPFDALHCGICRRGKDLHLQKTRLVGPARPEWPRRGYWGTGGASHRKIGPVGWRDGWQVKGVGFDQGTA